MPYLRLIDVEEAIGELRRQYDAAIGRAGKVFKIVKAMSLRPRVLASSMDLSQEIMFCPSELSESEDEPERSSGKRSHGGAGAAPV